MVSIFTKNLVNQWRSAIDFNLWKLVSLLEVDEFFVESINFFEYFFFNLIFVEEDTDFSKRRVVMSSSKRMFLLPKIFRIEFTSITDAMMLRIKTLEQKSRTTMFAERLIEKVKVFLCCIIIRDIEPNICIQDDYQIQISIFDWSAEERSSQKYWSISFFLLIG